MVKKADVNPEQESLAQQVITQMYWIRWWDEGIKTYVGLCIIVIGMLVVGLVQGQLHLKDLGMVGLALLAGLVYIPTGRFCWWVIVGGFSFIHRPAWSWYNRMFWGIAAKKVFAKMHPDQVLDFMNSRAGRKFLMRAFHFSSEQDMLESMAQAGG